MRVLRLILSNLQRARDPEVKARLQGVAGARRDLAAALTFASEKTLHRDPVYIAALTESAHAETADLARKRLDALLGRGFADRGEFEAWYAKHEDRLVWDEAKGRYGMRR